jgi:hypothetical protein
MYEEDLEGREGGREEKENERKTDELLTSYSFSLHCSILTNEESRMRDGRNV